MQQHEKQEKFTSPEMRARFPQHGKPWLEEQNLVLLQYFATDRNIGDAAALLGRSRVASKWQLHKLVADAFFTSPLDADEDHVMRGLVERLFGHGVTVAMVHEVINAALHEGSKSNVRQEPRVSTKV